MSDFKYYSFFDLVDLALWLGPTLPFSELLLSPLCFELAFGSELALELEAGLGALGLPDGADAALAGLGPTGGVLSTSLGLRRGNN